MVFSLHNVIASGLVFYSGYRAWEFVKSIEFTSLKTSDVKPVDLGLHEIQSKVIPDTVLLNVFLQLTKEKDLYACAGVSRQWRNVAVQDILWKSFALCNVLGQKIWNKANLTVGDDPLYYTSSKTHLSWKEVRDSQNAVSKFGNFTDIFFLKKEKVKEIEIDFLVPSTLDGKPTTLNRLLEIFSKSAFQIKFNIPKEFLEQYGEDQIERSYFARYTIDSIKGTYGTAWSLENSFDGCYRLPRAIEVIMVTFLLYQSGRRSDYSSKVRIIETMKIVEFKRMSNSIREAARKTFGEEGLRKLKSAYKETYLKTQKLYIHVDAPLNVPPTITITTDHHFASGNALKMF